MKLGTFTKQPGERISNSVVYAEALDEGDRVMTVVGCEVVPAGLEVSAVLVGADRVRLWCEGGEDEVTYKVTLRVETKGGEVLEDEVFCRVREV